MSNSPTQNEPRPRARGKALRIAIGVAVIVHVAILTFLWMYYINPRDVNSKAIAVDSHNQPLPQKKRTPEGKSQPELTKEEAEARQMQQQLQEKIAIAEGMSQQEKQDELDRRAKWLEENSNKENLEQISKTISQLAGTMQRATEPSENSTDENFDYDTAQIHEVLRKKKVNGGYEYFYLMLDANGQTMNVDVPQAEGVNTYETFEKLKKSPLAMKIYRQMVMPLLDQTLKNKRAADQLPVEELDQDSDDN